MEQKLSKIMETMKADNKVLGLEMVEGREGASLEQGKRKFTRHKSTLAMPERRADPYENPYELAILDFDKQIIS